jgi:hypothetical protein
MKHTRDIQTEVTACGAGDLVDWRPDYADLTQPEQLLEHPALQGTAQSDGVI